MNDGHITDREFERYAKQTAKSIDSLATGQKALLKEISETNKILVEHTVINNSKHDKTAERMKHLENRVEKIAQVVESREEVIKVFTYVKWAITIILVGALGAYGKYKVDKHYAKKERQSHIAESHYQRLV